VAGAKVGGHHQIPVIHQTCPLIRPDDYVP